jgi:hypothetical protein
MLMVIFGAGASYDSVSHCPPSVHRDSRPPLADHLFDTRDYFEQALGSYGDAFKWILPVLRDPKVNVEQELARYQSQAPNFPPAYQELAAIRHYLRFALWKCTDAWRVYHRGATNYGALLREIERWRYETKEQQVCLVTFNYDTMLEEAMAAPHLEFRITDLADYISRDQYIVIKLHGSINWAREINTPLPENTTPHDLVREAARLEISDRYRLIDSPGTVTQDGYVLYPAISIPVERKDEFSCPIEHVQALKRVLPNVTKIVTVGWRATELDFLQLLASTLRSKEPSLFVVSGDEDGAKETLANLKRYIHAGRETLEMQGFTGVTYNRHIFEKFLRLS